MDFLSTLPFEASDVSRDEWVRYAACVFGVCARDGLSDAESSAVRGWLAGHGAPEDVCAAAIARSGESVASLVGGMADVVGPYLVRDAIRLAKVDGLSDEEMQGAYELGRELGLDTGKVDAVRSAIEAYESAGRHWQVAAAR